MWITPFIGHRDEEKRRNLVNIFHKMEFLNMDEKRMKLHYKKISIQTSGHSSSRTYLYTVRDKENSSIVDKCHSSI